MRIKEIISADEVGALEGALPELNIHKRNLQDRGVAKSCKTCKYQDGPSFDGPCCGCSAQLDFNHWEEKEDG